MRAGGGGKGGQEFSQRWDNEVGVKYSAWAGKKLLLQEFSLGMSRVEWRRSLMGELNAPLIHSRSSVRDTNRPSVPTMKQITDESDGG